MASSGLLHCVALLRTTRRNIPEDAILHSHCCENPKSYIKQSYFDKEKVYDYMRMGHILFRIIVENL
jgi:hypothetical protein